jgi:hypothetical protein
MEEIQSPAPAFLSVFVSYLLCQCNQFFMTDITTDPCWWCELYESEKCIKTNLQTF